MAEKASSKNKSNSQTKKLSYSTPKVTVYGSVTKLTAAKATGGRRDGTGTKKT